LCCEAPGAVARFFRRGHAAVRAEEIQPCYSASAPLVTIEEQLDTDTQANSTHLTSSPLSCTVPLRTVRCVMTDKIPQPCYNTQSATDKSKAHKLVKEKCSLPPRAAKGNMSMKCGTEISMLEAVHVPFSGSPSRRSGCAPAGQFYSSRLESRSRRASRSTAAERWVDFHS
jgi:hypothetical protein